MKNTKIIVIAAVVMTITLYVAHYAHTVGLINVALKPCTSARATTGNLDYTKDIPCYQSALRVDPGNNFLKIRLADELVYGGRFNEAKPLYQQVASVVGLYQSEAKRKLLPGEMQNQIKGIIHSRQVLHDLQALTALHQKKQKEFLNQHAVSGHGMIYSMNEPYKTQWLQMRSRDTQSEKILGPQL